MRKIYLTIQFIIFSFFTKAQKKEIAYYKDQYFSKKTSAEKGKFQLITIRHTDGSVETIKQKINSDRVLEHYRNDEPIGIWSEGKNELNFDFTVEYTETGCKDTLTGINSTELFTNNDSLRYVAPKIASGQKDLYTFLSNEVLYPIRATNNGLSGKCNIFFTIDEQGNITNILAKKGSLAIFDKEVIRMIRKLKLSSPAMLNGTPKSICVKLPFKFIMH